MVIARASADRPIYREIVMTVFTSYIIASTMLALLPAGAMAAQKQIVVTAPEVSLNAWSGRVVRALDRNIDYPIPIRGEPNEGVASVKFLCSEDGTPSQVAIVKSSGSRDLDASAVRAVRRIATLHPLPDGITHDQPFQANIIYATSQKKLDRQMAALLAEAKNRNAWLENRSEKVALNIGFAAAH